MIELNKIYCETAEETLANLPDESINCVVTSPPYWGMRDYGTATWEGGSEDCEHIQIQKENLDSGLRNDGREHKGLYEGEKQTIIKMQYKDTCPKCGAKRIDKQLGLEKTPEEYVAKMVEIFREIRRVLRKDGTVWINLGSSYAHNGACGGSSPDGDRKYRETDRAKQEKMDYKVPDGFKPKDMIPIPWMVAMALQADGWVLRQDIIWSKLNPMPESVTDRCTKSHEYIFLFSKGKWTGQEGTEPISCTREDLIWLAAMIDTEGSICINRKQSGERLKNPTYASRISFYNSCRPLVEKVVQLTGVGQCKERIDCDDKRMVYQWQLAGPKVIPILTAIEPYLIAKKIQSWIAIELQLSNNHWGNNKGWGGGAKEKPTKIVNRQKELYEGCSQLNKTGETSINIKQWNGRWTSQPYTYDADAIKEPNTEGSLNRFGGNNKARKRQDKRDGSPYEWQKDDEITELNGRNKRSVWTVATQPYPDAHFATYPESLIAPCILAGCPQWVCPKCGKARERIVEKSGGTIGSGGWNYSKEPMVHMNRGKDLSDYETKTTGFTDCGCGAGFEPGIVYDPFMGSGTTAKVALKYSRNFIGSEINPDYIKLANKRIAKELNQIKLAI